MDRNDSAPPVATTDVGLQGAHRTDGGPVTFGSGPGTAFAARPNIEVGQNRLDVRNRVQWGPIIAGVVTTITTMIVLTILGLALGASVLDRNAPGGEIGSWAAIWGGASAIIAFFLGGVVAAKSAAVGGSGSGMLNGLMAGCATLVLLLWLAGSGLGGAFGLLGGNLEDVTNAVQNQAQDEGVDNADQAQAQAESSLRASFDEVKNSAWGTLGGLVLALGAAAVGGLIAHNKRSDLIEGTEA